MGNNYLYVAATWQGFIQQIILLMSSGYKQYCYVEYPLKKQDRFLKIDRKIIDRYKTDMSKNQLWKNKKEGNANFKFLRYENKAIIFMATQDFKGKNTKTREGVEIDDDFVSIDKKPLILKFGNELSLKIHTDGNKVTMSMTNEMFRDKRAEFMELASKKATRYARYSFSMLNGIPTYSGNFKQKQQLLDLLVSEFKRHNIKLSKKSFLIKNQRKKYKVFEIEQ